MTSRHDEACPDRPAPADAGGLLAPAPRNAPMRVRRMQLHTQDQAVAVMRRDCDVCRAEGLTARSQVLITSGERHIRALLFQVDGALLAPGDVALSETAWQTLGVADGDTVEVRTPPPLASLAAVRRRIYGGRLDAADMRAIVGDVAAGHYSDVHLAAFLTASATPPLDDEETIALTRAMVDVGDRLHWDAPIVVDKHCVGGLPGNRTTPLVVAIVAACGLLIPKTSSRAITSPAGTADTMEMLAPVDLDLPRLRDVVAREGGCIAWGGAMHLSPADDLFVRIGRELDIDTDGQLISSVLSKKVAAGSTHVLIDIPVGPTAKIRSPGAAAQLAARLVSTAAHFGLTLRPVVTDGSQPVGRGIGPALEAWDILAVLRREPGAPDDLRERSVYLAGEILDMAGVTAPGDGLAHALAVLDDGRAWDKFQRICDAQGGLREPPRAPCVEPLLARHSGRVTHIDNRKLARLAKLAGAPDSPVAGLLMQVRLDDQVTAGQPLLTLHAAMPGTLDYAMAYAHHTGDIVRIEPA